MASSSESDVAVVWSNQFDLDLADLEAKIDALAEDRTYRKKERPDASAPEADLSDEMLGLLFQCVILHLTRRLGKATFEIQYPHRETGADPQRRAYEDRLRAVQKRWNEVNASWGLPPVIIVDWSSLPPADAELSALDYRQSPIAEPGVNELLATLPPVTFDIRCNGRCRNSCRPPTETPSGSNCCSNLTRVVLEDDVVRLSASKAPRDSLMFRVECSDDCGCSEDRCENRAVQRGRQLPLLVYRNVEKGWTLHALDNLEEGAFVTEYIGKILLGPSSSAEAKKYDFTLDYDVPRPDGTSRTLYLNSFRKGNESRFAAHSCSPNVVAESTADRGRSTLAYKIIAFRAARKISRGEELTLDYLNGRGPRDGHYKAFFQFCLCRSPSCRFTQTKVKAHEEERQRRKSLKRAANADASGQEQDAETMEVDEEEEQPGPSRRPPAGAKKGRKEGRGDDGA